MSCVVFLWSVPKGNGRREPAVMLSKCLLRHISVLAMPGVTVVLGVMSLLRVELTVTWGGIDGGVRVVVAIVVADVVRAFMSASAIIWRLSWMAHIDFCVSQSKTTASVPSCPMTRTCD